jgi:ABC-2 type transport system permease protein
MRLFWELVRLSFRLQLTYRTANLAGMATNFFFGLLRAAVLIALFGEQQQVSGLTLAAVITYTGLSQATISILSFFGWWEVMQSVYSGEIAADLLKPMNYYFYWLARDLGRGSASFMVRGLVIMVAYALLFDLVLPQSLAHWGLVALSLLLGFLVSFGWQFFVNLAAFWTPEARGIGRLGFSFSWFLSGFIMPLRLFPPWFERAARWTPFPSMVNAVVEIYMGVLTGPEIARTLLIQIMWALLLFAASQVVLSAGVRRLVLQGG